MKNKKLVTICAVVTIMMIFAVSSMAEPTWLSMDITGVIEAPGPAQVDDWMQVGPIGINDDAGTPFAWGTIDSYSASSNLPQNAGDLGMYGWSMVGTIDSIVDHTITYSGTGEIYYGATYKLEEFTWNMEAVFVSDWSTNVTTGTLNASDTYNFSWPVGPATGTTVDWSIANPGVFTGTFDSSTNTLTGTVTVVPVPGAILLGILGLSVAGVKLRKSA